MLVTRTQVQRTKSSAHLTVDTESLRVLVVLNQVCDARESRVCVPRAECSRVLDQNLPEQNQNQGEVDNGHMHQTACWPDT